MKTTHDFDPSPAGNPINPCPQLICIEYTYNQDFENSQFIHMVPRNNVVLQLLVEVIFQFSVQKRLLGITGQDPIVSSPTNYMLTSFGFYF